MISIPILNAADIGTQREDTFVNDWNCGFRNLGLVYLIGHNLGPLFKVCAAEWEMFYSQSLQEKQMFATAQYGLSGYNCDGREAVSLSEQGSVVSASTPDPVESLECGYSSSFLGSFPRAENGYIHGDSLREASLTLYQALHELILSLLRISSKALQLATEEDLARRWYEMGEGAYQLRYAHYLDKKKGHEFGDGRLLYGDHTDYDGFTILWRSRSNGLQAYVGDTYIDVPVLSQDPDALVINLGDLMQLWTNDYWHSPRHRVLRQASEPSRELERDTCDLVSIVFFAGPHGDTKLEPLHSPLISGHDEQHVHITAAEHVQSKIRATAQS